LRILVFALAALLVLAIPADAPAPTQSKALKIARQADRRSRLALTRANAALADSVTVVRGADGSAGIDGTAGRNGRDGAAGPQGEPGLPGIAGSAMRIVSATNAEAVRIGAVFTTREEVIAAVGFEGERPFITADAELREVRNYPTPITCTIRVDATDVETREFDLAAGGRMSIHLSASPTLDAGGHSARLVCRRTDGRTDAIAEVPARRARLTVLAG